MASEQLSSRPERYVTKSGGDASFFDREGKAHLINGKPVYWDELMVVVTDRKKRKFEYYLQIQEADRVTRFVYLVRGDGDNAASQAVQRYETEKAGVRGYISRFFGGI
jgi:hypothetical protein